MVGFRTLRFFGGALVFTLIATGNGEVVLTAARTAVSFAEQTYAAVNQMAETGQDAAKAQGAAGTGAKSRADNENPTGSVTRKAADEASHDDHGTFNFTRFEDGQPVRWCAPEIRLLVNDEQAPAGAIEDFRKAVAQVSAASGISLRIVGDTNLIADRSSHLRAGDPYPEVLVSWARPEQSDLLAPGASGVTTANPARTDTGMRLVTGAVVFNTDHDTLYQSGYGKGMTRGNLFLHELSHLLGLGHVDDSGELMASTIGQDTPAGLSAGDRAGLRAAGGC
jgi:hypothetical protein